jgi:hypothetical protein|tara:strand:- start:142 stop:348 length:207 start_codon:yes stop_codon:yes gene_type:complete
MKSETINIYRSVNMKKVERLIRAITLINEALEVTRTLGDDIRMPLVECEIAILKMATNIDNGVSEYDS